MEDFRGSFVTALHVMGVSSSGQPSVGVEHFNLQVGICMMGWGYFLNHGPHVLELAR